MQMEIIKHEKANQHVPRFPWIVWGWSYKGAYLWGSFLIVKSRSENLLLSCAERITDARTRPKIKTNTTALITQKILMIFLATTFILRLSRGKNFAARRCDSRGRAWWVTFVIKKGQNIKSRNWDTSRVHRWRRGERYSGRSEYNCTENTRMIKEVR